MIVPHCRNPLKQFSFYAQQHLPLLLLLHIIRYNGRINNNFNHKLIHREPIDFTILKKEKKIATLNHCITLICTFFIILKKEKKHLFFFFCEILPFSENENRVKDECWLIILSIKWTKPWCKWDHWIKENERKKCAMRWKRHKIIVASYLLLFFLFFFLKKRIQNGTKSAT